MRTTMKTLSLFLSFAVVTAFSPSALPMEKNSLTKLNMFSGAGEAAPKEDDEGKMAEMEKMAKAMGMSVDEYQLGMNARMRMEEDIKNLRVTGGDAATVIVERDGNSPPVHLVVTITEDGKALGKEKLEKELVSALKSASEQSKKGRDQAQNKMMQFIAESMKGMGA